MPNKPPKHWPCFINTPNLPLLELWRVCVDRCREALELVLRRLPLHYKSMYRLAHLYLTLPSMQVKFDVHLFTTDTVDSSFFIDEDHILHYLSSLFQTKRSRIGGHRRPYKVALASASTFSGSVVRTPSGGKGLPKMCCRRTSRLGHLCSQCSCVCGSFLHSGHVGSAAGSRRTAFAMLEVAM